MSDCIVPSEKFGGGGMMVWGCFSGAGFGTLVPVKETLNDCDGSSMRPDDKLFLQDMLL